VAAKTGTAQLGIESQPGLSHAWIVAFAPADAPQYAVAVTLTNVEETPDAAVTGGRYAGPIAKAMLDYLLTGDGATVPLGAGTLPTTSTPPADPGVTPTTAPADPGVAPATTAGGG
jgi:hypothetical protein